MASRFSSPSSLPLYNFSTTFQFIVLGFPQKNYKILITMTSFSFQCRFYLNQMLIYMKRFLS